ncbi:hypothetical protein LMG27952_00790 [Paraburkholderia hiiakae]|uniref:Uncharacterized protein n=1 Tax=Paraburkholderia hiiakae TaxID=1081782 RepID=A0ABM8NBI8_9BURK|nr:hypothetical protein [Paraburkholderia hiiakae]CAD6513831.1 hypothetical protein LMG27952_00790 [Paraburkholderia hiiakae]
MSMAMPKEIRDRIRQKIWDKADELGWATLSDADRTIWYENWSKDKDVGGALAHFMDPRKVRVYIKDSLLKPYLRGRLEGDAETALLAAGLGEGPLSIKATFNKPHGRLLLDGRVICWGNSRDWKAIVISVFERAYRLESGIPYAAVLLETGRTTNDGVRDMIRDVAARLQLNQVVWLD